MSLQVPKSAPKKINGRVEDGVYPARIVQIIDLGTQVQTDWQSGEPKVDKHGNVIEKPEVWINYEFPTERISITDEEGNETDRPRWQGARYVVSSHEKSKMFALMNACGLNPKGNVAELLGKAVSVQVASTSNGNAKIKGVTAMMKGMQVPELENEAKLFDLDSPDEGIFDSLPNFLQEAIQGAPEYKLASQPAQDEPELDDDDIPF
jgi:ribosomal protein S11